MKKFLFLIIQFMKWSFYIVFMQTLMIGLLHAETVHSQNSISVKDVFISVKFENSSIGEVFHKIESLTTYTFSYDEADIKSHSGFSYEGEKISVADLLMEISKNANLRFRQIDNLINVSPIKNDGKKIEIIEIIRTEKVTGQVRSGIDKQPIPGVTVIEKGTLNGTVTDIDGRYSITVTDSATLVFSSIGFATQEVKVNGRTVIDVMMHEGIRSLDEIVIVGYGKQKRSNLTGSISSIKVKDLENRPIIRLDQALQGMSSGVFVSKGGGAPGASPTVHIRGVGSISNTDPLWIVDGIKMAPGNHFNLDDVASIEILKDAASAAIYGAEAAHGVILVTTKRGKGDLQVTYKSSFGKVNPIRLPELLGSEDFVKYKKQSRLNAGQNPEPAWDNWEHDTDWIEAYYAGSGFSQYHDLSVSKGNDKFNYYLSLGYDDEEGILIDNDFQRYSVRFNSDIELAKWIRIGESALISRVTENPIDNYNENRDGNGNFTGAIPYRSIPIMPIRDENNEYGGWGQAPVYFQGGNPVASQYQQHEERVYNRLDGNFYLLLTPFTEGLSFRASVGYNYMAYLGRAFKEAFNYGAFADPINSLTYSDRNDETITANFVGTYAKSLGKHSFKVMAGYEASQYEGSHYNVTATNFPIDVAWSFNLSTGTFNTTDRYTIDESRLLSQFGRVNYNFDEKYFLEANIRRDASAPYFGPKNIWGIFPSYSAAWRISEEAFFRVPFVSDLKLRASSGKLGSDNIRKFIYDKTYTSQFSTYAFEETDPNKVSGFYISRFPNEDVKWEEVNMHNIGLDVGLLEGKLSFSADYYIKDTEDLLYGVPIPASVGISTHNFDAVNPEINIGTMRNTGVDLDLTYRQVYDKFNLTVNGNTSFMKNEVLFLNADEYITSGSGGGQIGGMTRTQAGMPISSFYGYIVQQMLNSPEDVYAVNSWAPDGIYQEGGTGPGDFMYRDISGPEGVPDGQVTAEHDRTFIGNPWPKMMYGLNINLVYNQVIDIMLQFQGVQGVDIFNANKAYSRNFFGDYNTTTDIYEAWTEENHTDHPRNIASDPNGNFSRPSTYFIEDGSYLKLRNAQIGFNIPSPVLEKAGIDKVRIYLNANNLLTLTKYSGMDPEIAGSNVGRGVDYGLYPHTRTFGGGIEVQF